MEQRADEEAARLYEEFVESFKVDDIPGGKAFVRGGTINPNERLKAPSEAVLDPEVNRPAVATTMTPTPGGTYRATETSSCRKGFYTCVPYVLSWCKQLT